MAKIYENFASENLMSFGKSFSRLNGQPLDKSELWYNLKSAQDYAKTDAAYVGQKIVVIDKDAGTLTHYSIKNAAGDLEELGASVLVDNKSVELNGKVVSLKNFGKEYYAYNPETHQYTLTQGFIDGLEVKVRKTTGSDGSDQYELAYYQPNPTTVEGLQSEIANLKTRADTIEQTANEAKTTAESKINSVVGKTDGAIGVTTDGSHNSTIELKIDTENKGNVELTQTASGLKANVTIPNADAYTIEKLGAPEEGYASSYRLTKNGSAIAGAATINIPKDLVVQSGTVVNNPEGQEPGTYIELVLANATNDKIYVNVGTLIEYVTSGSTAGDMVYITIDDQTHKVTATITDGTITKEKLDATVQASLGKADSAVQSVTVLGFTLNNGSELTVEQAKTALGLGTAAFKNVEDFEAAGTIDTKIETALAWKSIS